MKRLGRMLGEAVGRDEVLRAGRAQKVLRGWDQVVGPELAARSHPERYDRGTVWVAVSGSAWAQELRMMEETILARLRESAGDPTLFQRLRFGVRPFQKEPPEEPAASEPGVSDETRALSIREIAERRLRSWSDDPGG